MNPLNPLIKKIKNYFKTQKDVVAVYIFGSYAVGQERTFSDIDIAVLIDPEKTSKQKQLHSEYLAKLSRITRLDVDLINMNTASEVLLKQIYIKGQCILIQDINKLSVFKMISYSRIADFGYHHAKMQRGVIKSIREGVSIG